jgi:hypothetical protein
MNANPAKAAMAVLAATTQEVACATQGVIRQLTGDSVIFYVHGLSEMFR